MLKRQIQIKECHNELLLSTMGTEKKEIHAMYLYQHNRDEAGSSISNLPPFLDFFH